MNYPRTKYEMTEADLEEILEACKPVPYIVIGGVEPSSPQENANRAWEALGKKMGFDHMTVRPEEGGNRFFSAIPSETEEQKQERLKREAEKARAADIARLEQETEERQKQLADLKAP
jgi:hypothetical protein